MILFFVSYILFIIRFQSTRLQNYIIKPRWISLIPGYLKSYIKYKKVTQDLNQLLKVSKIVMKIKLGPKDTYDTGHLFVQLQTEV